MGRSKKLDEALRTGNPTKPEGLSARAGMEWDRLLAEINSAGLQLTPAHRAAVSLAATIGADIAEAYAQIRDAGPYEHNKKTGCTQMHPAAKRIDALRRDYIKVLTVIGLRPGTSDGSPDGETLEDVLNA